MPIIGRQVSRVISLFPTASLPHDHHTSFFLITKARSSRGMGAFCPPPPRNVWPCLETFLDIRRGGGCFGHWMDRMRDAAKHPPVCRAGHAVETHQTQNARSATTEKCDITLSPPYLTRGERRCLFRKNLKLDNLTEVAGNLGKIFGGGGGLGAESCPTFATPWTVACQGPLSMGILQARMMEWVASSFSRGSSQPRNRTRVSCIAGRCFTNWAAREAEQYLAELNLDA